MGLAALVLVAGCGKDYAPLNSQVSSFAPTPTPVPLAYEDGEKGSMLYPYSYQDGVSTISMAVTGADYYSGTNCLHFLINSAGGSWGAGGGFSTNYPNGATYGQNELGKVKVTFWIKTNANQKLTITIKEGAGTKEEWKCPAKNIAASASWQYFEILLSTFTLAKYPGNSILELDDIINLDMYFAQLGVVNNNIYVDDIVFK